MDVRLSHNQMAKATLMLRFRAALILLLLLWPSAAFAQYVGTLNQIQCNKTASITTATATTTSVLTGVVGQATHICGYLITSSVASGSTLQLEYGTQGGPCSTPTVLSGALNLSTNAIVNRGQFAYVSVPTGAQVCIVTAGASVGATFDLY